MGVYVLRSQPLRESRGHGTTVLADAAGFSDPYYTYWHADVYGNPGSPTASAVALHFCESGIRQCEFGGARRGVDPIALPVHVNRWRPLTQLELGSVRWLTVGHREAVARYVSALASPPELPETRTSGQGSGQEAFRPGNTHATRAEDPSGDVNRDLAGLARALGLPEPRDGGASATLNPERRDQPATPAVGALRDRQPERSRSPPGRRARSGSRGRTASERERGRSADRLRDALIEFGERIRGERRGGASGSVFHGDRRGRSSSVERRARDLLDRVTSVMPGDAEAARRAQRARDRDASPRSGRDLSPARDGGTGASRLHRAARESPGSLAEQGLSRMQGYLVQSGGGLPLAGGAATVLPPVALAYLSTVYLPTHPEASIGLRSSREMRTLAMAIDLILGGHLLHALDVLLQRFKALELAAEQGSWSQARWLELIPTSDVSSWSRDDLRSAMREQELELRLGLVPGPRDKGHGRGHGSRSDGGTGPDGADAAGRGRGKGKGRWRAALRGRGQPPHQSGRPTGTGTDRGQGSAAPPPAPAVPHQ
jgi:hypothetical protein